MNLTPEVLGSIRMLLIAAGGFLVGKGWLDSAGLDALVTVLMAAIAAWAIYAKRPRSAEAQQIAQNVVDSPTSPKPLNAEGNEVK
jgi:hypothetical protein